MSKDTDLKLIYVLKIGYNSKGEGLYEFIFSEDETNIDYENWLWDTDPACDNAEPPTEDYVDAIYNLRTNSFDLFCLHEAVDRPYMHGYHLIHALAYEIEFQGEEQNGFNQYEEIFDNKEETPLLVFHYGMTLKRIKEMFYERKIVLKGKDFVESISVELK